MNAENSAICSPEKLVSGVVDLISLPEVYLRVTNLMDDPTACIDDFAQVIRTDPNLTARVLSIVNSAYFGFAGQIETVSRALNFIGIGQLHDLVLSVSAVKSFAGISNEIMDMSIFWQRSLYCGVLSRLLAEQNGISESERLFVIGLLHEIGHLILFSRLPDDSRQALDRSQRESRPLFEIEREMFGFHYGEIGAELMRHWNLPTNFQEITKRHIEPATAQKYELESAIVHIAHAFADSGNTGEESGNEQEYIDSFAWKIVGLEPETITPLLAEADQKSSELKKLMLGNLAT